MNPPFGSDEFWLDVAGDEAVKASCRRRNVGAVLTVAGVPWGYGHNWTPAGTSCDAGDCPRGLKSVEEAPPGQPPYDDCLSIHAEMTALMAGAAHSALSVKGFAEVVRGGTMYVTSKPCEECDSLLQKFGVVVIYPSAVA